MEDHDARPGFPQESAAARALLSQQESSEPTVLQPPEAGDETVRPPDPQVQEQLLGPQISDPLGIAAVAPDAKDDDPEYKTLRLSAQRIETIIQDFGRAPIGETDAKKRNKMSKSELLQRNYEIAGECVGWCCHGVSVCFCGFSARDLPATRLRAVVSLGTLSRETVSHRGGR
jgi:hypothetical protein